MKIGDGWAVGCVGEERNPARSLETPQLVDALLPLSSLDLNFVNALCLYDFSALVADIFEPSFRSHLASMVDLHKQRISGGLIQNFDDVAFNFKTACLENRFGYEQMSKLIWVNAIVSQMKLGICFPSMPVVLQHRRIEVDLASGR